MTVKDVSTQICLSSFHLGSDFHSSLTALPSLTPFSFSIRQIRLLKKSLQLNLLLVLFRGPGWIRKESKLCKCIKYVKQKDEQVLCKWRSSTFLSYLYLLIVYLILFDFIFIYFCISFEFDFTFLSKAFNCSFASYRGCKIALTP